MGLAVVYSLIAAKSYQSSLLLKVGTVFSVNSDGARLGIIEDPKTLSQVLTGDAILADLRRHLGLDRMTIPALRSALKVKVIKNDLDIAATTLLELSLTLADPQQAVNGLAFLADQLIEEHSRQYLAGLAIIDREQEGLQEKIRVAELQQETLKRQVSDFRAQMAGESKYRETLERNISRLENEMSQARGRLAEAKPDASEALWEQTLFQSRQIHLDQLYRERNESEIRGREAQAGIYSVESTATFLAGQRADYENRIVELAAYRTRSENTKIRSARCSRRPPRGRGGCSWSVLRRW
jgi:chromosome segregation ATPase